MNVWQPVHPVLRYRPARIKYVNIHKRSGILIFIKLFQVIICMRPVQFRTSAHGRCLDTQSPVLSILPSTSNERNKFLIIARAKAISTSIKAGHGQQVSNYCTSKTISMTINASHGPQTMKLVYSLWCVDTRQLNATEVILNIEAGLLLVMCRHKTSDRDRGYPKCVFAQLWVISAPYLPFEKTRS